MNETPDAPPTVTPPAARAASNGTEYLVLRKSGDGWDHVNKATARTTDLAIKTVVELLPEDEQAGTYVAVVASRWQPVEIEPKVERSLVLKVVK